MTVLRAIVVDDERLARRGLALRLAEFSQIEVIAECANGEEALSVIGLESPDLVFLDIQMPGMDGKATTARIRELETPGCHTPIVALTAHALESERRDLLDSGLDDYLSKPITEGQLRHTLEQWVMEKPHQPLPDSGEDSEPDNDKVFDEDLARRRAGGRQSLADEMLKMLLDSLSEDRPAISSAFDSGDQETLLERVHKLHGATRYCGTRSEERRVGKEWRSRGSQELYRKIGENRSAEEREEAY